MKSNALTIIKKEFARFFGDRQIVFTAVIMPGLLIYIIYSLMGTGIQSMITKGAEEIVTIRVENMPPSLAPVLSNIDSNIVMVEQPFSEEDVKMLDDKDLNIVMLRFPNSFDSILISPVDTAAIPNIEIYYNSTNNASNRVYNIVSGTLKLFR